MGLDLVLFPLRGPEELGKIEVFCTDRLRFQQDYDILGQIQGYDRGDHKPTLRADPIPPQMWVIICEVEGVEKTREDRYGEELTFAYAKELKKLKIPLGAAPKNKAIKAFINELPDEIPIILYWH